MAKVSKEAVEVFNQVYVPPKQIYLPPVIKAYVPPQAVQPVQAKKKKPKKKTKCAVKKYDSGERKAKVLTSNVYGQKGNAFAYLTIQFKSKKQAEEVLKAFGLDQHQTKVTFWI